MTYKPFGFDYKEIVKNVDSLKSIHEKENYLEWVLLEAKNIINKVKYNQLIFIGIDSKNRIPTYLGDQNKVYEMQNKIFVKMLQDTYNHLYKLHNNHEYITRERFLEYFNKLFFHFEKVTIKSIKNQIKKLKLELNNKRTNGYDGQKTFERWELKIKCKEYAKKLNLKKGEELTKEKVLEVCKELEKEGYKINNNSVASTLRDKLKYKKETY